MNLNQFRATKPESEEEATVETPLTALVGGGLEFAPLTAVFGGAGFGSADTAKTRLERWRRLRRLLLRRWRGEGEVARGKGSIPQETSCDAASMAEPTVILFSLLSSLFFASAVLERETRSGGCDFGTNTNSKMNSMKCLVCAEGAKDQGGELFFERKKK